MVAIRRTPFEPLIEPDRKHSSRIIDRAGWIKPGGDGPTLGRVATAPEHAALIWSFVDYGTRIEIHW